ncbi:hypothetical protein, partial [Pseudomonas aeruginosa]|uniref:hypothetical protein n=1 Tax=Pseudomonas aeruginosa TaxID=287 RepID=UPI001CC2E39E
AEALGTTDLNGGALFNAEFGIRHRGSTVPERSGVALSFCRRQVFTVMIFFWHTQRHTRCALLGHLCVSIDQYVTNLFAGRAE